MQTIAEQAEGILALRHAKYGQPGSVDPRANTNHMVKVDGLIQDIRDSKIARMEDDEFAEQTIKFR